MIEKRVVLIESADECPYCDEYVRAGELRCSKTGRVCVEGYGLGKFPEDCPLPFPRLAEYARRAREAMTADGAVVFTLPTVHLIRDLAGEEK